MKPGLLLVDDDPLIAESLAFVLEEDYALAIAGDRESAVARLQEMPEPPRLALIDLGLPPAAHLPTEGFKLIGDLLGRAPQARIVVLTGQNEESNARRARALGAADLVPKPCEPAVLKAVLRRVLAAGDLAPEPGRAEDGRALVGESPAMRKLRSQIDLYASSVFPVLIEGESGSGKELVARALHGDGPRAARALSP
jgi:DNA-binding NtrC family response regulator